jgi:hypothetical protein
MLREVLVEGGEDDVDFAVALRGLGSARLDHADAEVHETTLESAQLRDSYPSEREQREDHAPGIDVDGLGRDELIVGSRAASGRWLTPGMFNAG